MSNPGENPFDLGGTASTGRAAPRWVVAALFGPWLLLIAWVLVAEWSRSHPPARAVAGPLLGVAVVSAVVGYGGVFAACLFPRITTAIRGGRRAR